MEAQRQIEVFSEFISSVYQNDIAELVQRGNRSLTIDFNELSKHSIELAEQLLAEPEEVLKAAEIAMETFDIPYKNTRIRIKNLPKSQSMMIRDLRSEHLNSLLTFEGIVRQSSDVRPQVVSARFECPSCGNVITILQLDTKFKEPYRCTCSRKGRFKLLSKDLVDAQRLVLEESPETLEGGEQPKRLSVFLREDLVEPKMEKKTTPGSKIKVNGVIREVPISLKSGAQSIRYDIAAEANFIEPVEQTYEDIKITPEDEEQIFKLSKDLHLYDKLINSVAPTVFGHEEVKEAIVLQLMGGVKKTKEDGTKTRGDMHMLLVGDPGSAKSTILTYMAKLAPRGRYIAGMSSTGAGLCIAPNSLVLTNPGGIHEIKDIVEGNLKDNDSLYSPGVWNSNNPSSDKKIFTLDSNLKINPKEINQFWRIQPPECMMRIKTASGKEIEVTPNTKLCSNNLSWLEAKELKTGEYLATTRSLDFQENSKKILLLDLVKSNPIVLGVKDKVYNLVETACQKHNCAKRDLARFLRVSENNIYHNWVKEGVRGNITLRDLKLLAKYAEVPLNDILADETWVSLYKGHKITLPKYLDNDLLYLAGLIAGDGDLSKGTHTATIRFSNSSNQLIQKFKSISSQLFNVKLNLSSQKSEKRPESWRFSSNLVAEILNELGIPCSPKSHKIDLSNVLLKLPKSQLAHYLRGYYDTDGSCAKRNTKGSNLVESTSTSKNFSEKLKLLLLRFGIIARIREREASVNPKIIGRHRKHVLTISGSANLKRFNQSIGFDHPIKKEKLQSIVDENIQENTNVDIIPGARELIKECETILNISLLSNRKDKHGISRNYLLNLLDKLKHCKHASVLKLEMLANSDIFWDKIVSIEKVFDHGYKYVYDLTVEDSHNFIVNGVLVHNTATVVKDEFLRGWALEAGAMVLANGGFAMIDEMDKMNNDDRNALHEALEQQRVTIHKANIQATLKAETTVLAAANPKLGRFDPYQPIAAQIDLPPTLINRFDLIFPIKDIPNREKDERIASHVLSLHKSPEKIKSEIPIPLFKKYVAYARQRVFPKLTDGAIDEIKKFYVTLRNSSPSKLGADDALKPIPISARQLEALVRLSEGSARARLSEKVEREDARRAIRLLTNCLMQVGFDPETGQIDIDKISTGITTAQRSKIGTIREIINDLEGRLGKTIPTHEIVQAAIAHGLDESKVEDVIASMVREGMLFEPKRGFLSKV